MEIFPYLLDVVMFAFAIYWSVANYTRKSGTPTFGLFRFREDEATPADRKARKAWKR